MHELGRSFPSLKLCVEYKRADTYAQAPRLIWPSARAYNPAFYPVGWLLYPPEAVNIVARSSALKRRAAWQRA